MPAQANYNDNGFKEKIDFVIELFQKKLDRQAESQTTLLTKVNFMLAFSSLLVGGILTVLFDDKVDFACAPLFRILLGVGLLGLLVCVGFLLSAARNRLYYDPPDPETIYSERASAMSTNQLKNQVAADMKFSFNHNLKNQYDIAILLKWATIIFFASLSVIVATAFFLPECAKIGHMSENNTSSEQHHPAPVMPSPTPGTVVPKSPNTGSIPPNTTGVNTPPPVQPSQSAGTRLPFSESDLPKTNK